MTAAQSEVRVRGMGMGRESNASGRQITCLHQTTGWKRLTELGLGLGLGLELGLGLGLGLLSTLTLIGSIRARALILNRGWRGG